MDDLLPRGVMPYLLGGLLIGGGISLIRIMTGRIAGLSSFLTAAQAWWSRRPVFRTPAVLEERRWKTVLVVAIIVGSAVYTLASHGAFQTTVPIWRLLAGGVLVGFGTRLGRGCTSGHGICGVASLAPASLVATMLFLGIAIVTAHLLEAMGAAR